MSDNKARSHSSTQESSRQGLQQPLLPSQHAPMHPSRSSASHDGSSNEAQPLLSPMLQPLPNAATTSPSTAATSRPSSARYPGGGLGLSLTGAGGGIRGGQLVRNQSPPTSQRQAAVNLGRAPHQVNIRHKVTSLCNLIIH